MSNRMELIAGYRYTTMNVIRYDELKTLEKFAKRENRRLKRNNRIERYVVYPVPGKMPGMGQLCILV